jgi:hypothetical protein
VAELSVVSFGVRRPSPPDELTEEQAKEWRSIVERMPSDWFKREQFALLVAYCRHVCRARFLAKQIEAFKPEWLKAETGPARLDKFLCRWPSANSSFAKAHSIRGVLCASVAD